MFAEKTLTTMEPSSWNLSDYDIFGSRYQLPLIASESQTKEVIILNATILFAERGVPAVSMRDIAASCGIKPASLYNHFESKKVLWREVLEHAKELYLLYFRHLEKELGAVRTFYEILDTIFREPIKLRNSFTCYAFTMVQAEQFRDENAAEVFNSIMLEYAIGVMRRRFEQCIEEGLVEKFDTRTVATVIIHSVLICLEIKVQEYLGRPPPYDPSRMLSDLQRLIASMVRS
ncbi:MAG: TetR/AcrR family transcriptional regulator [Planctomycetota bacterium]|jgi:AcrR family transcriptional regulator|nr:TetR/AcrR family transcriptional regulator [Planctomycetota bacterium]